MPKRYHITLKNVPINKTIRSEDFLNIPNWPKRENIQANSSSNTSIFNATWSVAKNLVSPIKVTVAINNSGRSYMRLREGHLYVTNKYYYDRGEQPSAGVLPRYTFILTAYGEQFDTETDLYLGEIPMDWYDYYDENTMLEDPEEITLYYSEEYIKKYIQ